MHPFATALPACLRRGWPLLAAIFLGSCGSSSTCAPRHGYYKVDLSPQSGNCGPISALLVGIGHPADAARIDLDHCDGEEQASDDSCSPILHMTCPAGTGFHADLQGPVTWDRDGYNGSGTARYEQTNDTTNELLCSENFAVQYTIISQ